MAARAVDGESSPAPCKVQDSDPVYIIRENTGFWDLLGVWAILELRIAYTIRLNSMIYPWGNVGNFGKSWFACLYYADMLVYIMLIGLSILC